MSVQKLLQLPLNRSDEKRRSPPPSVFHANHSAQVINFLDYLNKRKKLLPLAFKHQPPSPFKQEDETHKRRLIGITAGLVMVVGIAVWFGVVT